MRRFFQRRKARKLQNSKEDDSCNETGSDTRSNTDSNPGSSPKIFPVGIRTLYESQASTVDVVFVHGLTGDRERTWSTPGRKPWPQELLPKMLPSVRVLTFGYDAYVVDITGVVSQNRIDDHAMNLVTALSAHRESDDTQTRPIIFVCHSLGGLVCQDALVLAKQRPEAHLKQIYTSTHGVIFMGTPHRGSGLATWGEMLARSLGLIKQTNSAILEVLTRKSEMLARIQDGFLTLVRARGQENLSPIEITCFFEELPLQGLGMVVPRESAAMPGFVPISIRQNHMNMTKFASEHDPGFILVVAELRRWTRQAKSSAMPPDPTPVSPQFSEAEFLASIGPRRYRHIDPRVPGTCSWVTETTQYHAWLFGNNSSVLWVTGAAGTGKTTLAKFLVEQLEQQYTVQGRNISSHVVCSFFCSREVERQHDVSSLLQDLTLQLAQPQKHLVKLIKNMYGSRQKHILSSETTWRLFETVINALPCQHLFITIDALDECDGDWGTQLLRKLAHALSALTNTSLPTRKNVKIILCGQPQIRSSWGLVDESVEHHRIDFEDRTTGITRDLQLFIDVRVAELVAGGFCTSVAGEYLTQNLKARAESSFLWLNIIFKHIQQGLGYHTEDVKQMLTATPGDLQEAYAKYLPTIAHSNHPILQHYLQLLIACSRPLTLFEIDVLKSTIEERSTATRFPAPDETAVRGSMQRALGPLVKFADHTAQFVHSTVREFFLLLSQQPQHPLCQSHGVELDKAHLLCAKACMSYLLDSTLPSDLFDMADYRPGSASTNMSDSMSDPQGDGDEDDDGMFANLFDIGEVPFLKDPERLEKETCAKISQSYTAFDYAAVNWTYHLERAKNILDERSLSMALRLFSGENGRCSDWYRYQRHQTAIYMPPSSEVNAVILSAIFDLPELIERAMTQFSAASNARSLSSAIFWASSRNSEDSVKLLLNSGAPVNAFRPHQIPLAVAVQGGFEEICDLLLAAESIEPNETDSQGKSALILAAEANHTRILKRLLSHNRIRADLTDAEGRTAFIAAARRGSLECLQTLRVDGRSDVNKADSQGRTALLHACHSGHFAVLRELLNMTDVAIDAKDNSKRNAISLASQEGHMEIVKYLFKKHVDPAIPDSRGRNSISWAASSQKAYTAAPGKESVLQYLVRKAPLASDNPDNEWWTPLAWALDAPGHLKTVEVLLQLPEVNVNQRDKGGKCLLHWVASAGLTGIVRCFLERPDIDVNATNPEGLTPLASAAASGMADAVKLLLQHPAIDTSLADRQGRRAVDWARLNRHFDVVDLLQRCLPLGDSQDQVQ